MFIYFWGRKHEWGRGRQRGTEDPRCTLRWQQQAWCGTQTHEPNCEIMTWPEARRSTDWATQGSPCIFFCDCCSIPLTFIIRHRNTKRYSRESPGSTHGFFLPLLGRNKSISLWLLKSITPAGRLTPIFSLLVPWYEGPQMVRWQSHLPMHREAFIYWEVRSPDQKSSL